MQEFKPDCTLNLATFFKGKGRPVLWAITLSCKEHAKIEVSGRLRVDTLEEVEVLTAHYALQLLTNLKQDKVEVRINFDFGKYVHGTGKKNHQMKGLQSELVHMKYEIITLWGAFRLKRIGEIKNDDLQRIYEFLSY